MPKLKKKKPGPKPLPKQDFMKTRRIRFSDRHWGIIERAAKGNGTPSKFVRDAALTKAKEVVGK